MLEILGNWVEWDWMRYRDVVVLGRDRSKGKDCGVALGYVEGRRVGWWICVQ